MSSSNEPKRVIAWGRIFFVAIIVVILANFGKISSFFGSVFAPVIYDEIDPFSDMLVEVSGTEQRRCCDDHRHRQQARPESRQKAVYPHDDAVHRGGAADWSNAGHSIN